MNQVAKASSASLPSLIDRASQALASAKDSGHVLEARDLANVAYAAAKSAGRMARAKKAHDDVLGAVYRAQADALLIEARAKSRLADEYDAAQERGEVAGHGGDKTSNVAKSNVAPTAADLGLRRDEIHEARKIRDWERDEPGVIERTLSDIVERGEEPTKAALKHVHVTANTGNNEWYTPAHILAAARAALGSIELDPASSDTANERVGADEYYTEAHDALSLDWPPSKIWMNPPYARGMMQPFVEKLLEACANGSEAVVLVNNATETEWFQLLLRDCDAVCFPRGRIKYHTPSGDNSGTPLQGQAIFYIGPDSERSENAFNDIGGVLCSLHKIKPARSMDAPRSFWTRSCMS